MTRTPTLPTDDPKMWRQLIARTHPDAGGSHELFIWTGNLKELVCSDSPPEDPTPIRPEPTRETDPERVPFPPGTDFETLTRRAVMLAADEPLPHRSLLRLLRDCEPLAGFEDKQRRGASYRQLAAVAHQASMTKTERVQWYRVAERIPLSDRHAGHLLGRLKRRAA